MNNKNLITVGAAVLFAAALSGCAGTGQTVTKPDTAASAAPVAPAPVVTPTPAADETKNAAFGDTVTYDDGVSITVSKPVEFTPGQYAVGAEQAHQLKVTFTIKNGSSKNLQPMAFPKVVSASTEASSIFDSNAGLNNAPSTVILPGKSVTWAQGFSVADPADLVLQVSPGFTYNEAIFTNAG